MPCGKNSTNRLREEPSSSLLLPLGKVKKIAHYANGASVSDDRSASVELEVSANSASDSASDNAVGSSGASVRKSG